MQHPGGGFSLPRAWKASGGSSTEIMQMMPNVGRICAGLRGSRDTKESHSKAHAPDAFTSAFKMLLFFNWGCFTVPGSVSNSVLFIRFSHAELFTSFTLESSCSAQIGWIGR